MDENMLTVTVAVAHNFHLRRHTTRTMVALECLQKALVEEARLLLRSAALFEVVDTHVEWAAGARIHIRFRIALFPVLGVR